MNIDEIRNNAPQYASHYMVNGFSGDIQYVKIGIYDAYVWCDYDADENRWIRLPFINEDNVEIYMIMLEVL